MDFKKILNLTYTHRYFKDSIASGLFTIVPLDASKELLKNLQLNFKKTSDGFFVFLNDAKDDYFITPPAESSLSFAFYSNNEYLLNFSDIEYITPGEQILYYYIDSESSDLQPTQDYYYPFQLKGLLVNDKPFTVDRVNPPFLDANQKTAVQGDDGKYYLDISHWPDALYEISDSDGNTPDSFHGKKYFAGRDMMANPPLLIVEWPIPESMPQNPQLHRLKIVSRSVYWQYQITEKDSQLSDLSIYTTGVEEILFGEVKKINGRWISFSNEKIDLTQVPKAGIKLNGIILDNTLDANKKNLIANLPNPNVANIFKYDNDNNNLIGEFPGAVGDFYCLIQVVL